MGRWRQMISKGDDKCEEEGDEDEDEEEMMRK